ncbi:MAG: NAD(P)H-hydrate epimerase, partial [Kineosporiaceae bacterium]
MRTAYRVEQVRAAEAALMAALPPGTLMGRAADGLARTCLRLLGRAYGARVVLFVGTGDNGGDALYAGARLARRGARVDAVLVGPRAHAGGLGALLRAGGRAAPLDEAVGAAQRDALALVAGADLVVDGVLGIGGRGALREPAASLAEAAADSGAWCVAVDLPSGVDADSGHVEGAAFTADVTVVLGCLKPGVLVDPGRGRSGVVEPVDIGLAPHLPDVPDVRALEAADVTAAWPYPGSSDDKYTRGVVGVAAGSPGYPGAAVLAVSGAVRAGAGMVRFAGDPETARLVSTARPEAVVGEGRVQAWVVGPGIGTGPEAADRVREVLATDVPV